MNFFNKKEKNILNTSFYNLFRFFRFKNLPFFNASAENALKINMFFTCVKILSNSLATMPVNIINKNNQKINDDLSFLLKNKPNNNQTAFNFWQEIMFDLLLFGNAYVLISRNPKGEIVALQRLQACLTEPIKVDSSIEYHYNGIDIFYQYEVIHYKMLSLDGLIGIKPIDLLIEPLNTSDKLNIFLQSENFPPILKTPEELLQDEQVVELSRQIDDKLSNKPFILPAGFELILGNARNVFDTKFAELKKFSNEEIARFFNIPFGLIGLDGASQPNVLDTQNRLFLQQALNPYLRMIEQTTENSLFSRSDLKKGYRIKFNRNAIVYQTDPNSRVNFFIRMKDLGIYDIDKIKELEDLNC